MNFFSIDGHYSNNDFSEHFTLPTSSFKNPEFITLDELAKINKSIKLQDKKSKPFGLKVNSKNEICVTKNQKTICLPDKDFKSVKESTLDISKEIARSRLKLLSPRDKSTRRRSLISQLSESRSPKRKSLINKLSKSRSPKRKSLINQLSKSRSPKRKSSKPVSSKSLASKPISFKDLLSKGKTSKITSPTSVSSSKTPNSTSSYRRPNSASSYRRPNSASSYRRPNSASSYRRPSTKVANKNTLPVNNKVIKQISSNVSSSKRR